jgi:adenylosuccinate synthase
LDASAGSSGKGKIASFIGEHADDWQFCCNTFSAQAGHWVKVAGKEYFYQTFNSCAYLDKYEKMYVGPGASIELEALFREIDESNIKPHKIGIHPLATIIQDKDAAFERGEVDFDGNAIEKHDGTMKTGSTCHGVGACRARRVLRRPDLLIAKDIPELKEFICDTTEEIIDRLEVGQSGLLEIAQGFQLSLMLPRMYPYCTSRNVTIAAGFDDMMLPIVYAGNVILNCRTYPIRINSNKYRDRDTGEHLVWDQVKEYENKGKLEIYKGDSGPGYDDQKEITWEELTESSGSPEPIMEMTSVTKLPRRVFTFSKANLQQAIRYNQTNGKTFISVNFANYVDHEMAGRSGVVDPPSIVGQGLTKKFNDWLSENIVPAVKGTDAELRFVGTGPLTDEMVVVRNEW